MSQPHLPPQGRYNIPDNSIYSRKSLVRTSVSLQDNGIDILLCIKMESVLLCIQIASIVSLIRTFRLSEHTLVPACADKWLPAVLGIRCGTG